MDKGTMDSRWMDELDHEIQPGLTCDIKLTIESGDTYREILSEAARLLRATAAQIEDGKLEDGFHPIRMLSGEEAGELYLDYYGTSER
jgi:hypothetical protein